MTGIESSHIHQSLNAITHWVTGGDSCQNIKIFSLFLYAHLCFQGDELYKPILLQFIHQHLKDPKDHCYLEVIEDWAQNRPSLVLIKDDAFFIMLNQLKAYYIMSFNNTEPPYYGAAYPKELVFWQQAPVQNPDFTMNYGVMNPYLG